MQVFQLKNKCTIQGPKINGGPSYGCNLLSGTVNSIPYAKWQNLAQSTLRQDSDLSPKSKKRRLSSLKGFAEWLKAEEGLSLDIDFSSPGPGHRKLPHFISVDEAISLMKHLKTAPKDNKTRQQTLLFYLMYGCGLRVSEACEVSWPQVHLDKRQIRVMGKGSKERLAILPMAVVTLLKSQPRDHHYIYGEKPLPTRTAYERIRQLGKQAGLIKPIHPHALRHSYATHLLSSGSDLRVLQQLLGHESLSATEQYTHLDTDQLARTMESFHPLSKK